MNRHAFLIGINRYPKVPNADLRGCVNDVELMRSVLTARFGFPAAQVRTLIDEQATQAGIRGAFDELAATIGENDVVAFFYAGHGSRMRDPRDPERIIDSIVPHDSGRGTEPNRDIRDEEIDRWVQRLNRKTPHVTLIIDCCHSGDITRDVFGEAVRELPADLRSIGEMLAGEEPLPEPPREPTRALDADPGRAGWVLGRRRAVVVAACRADELANEYAYFNGEKMVRDGAMTYFLCRAMNENSGTGTTWRDVFARLSPTVNAEYTRQHPQIEGKMDELLFGTEQSRPAPYLEIAATGESVADEGVELAGGAAHGVMPGSHWTVRPHGAHHRAAGDEVARVEVVEVGSASSRARVLEAAAPPRVGQRAFLLRHEVPPPALRVAVRGPANETFAETLAATELLQRVDDAEHAEVLVRGRESSWDAVGRDGRRVARPRADEPEALAELVRDLARVGRFRRLLALENPDPASRLRRDARLRIRRFDAAAGELIDAEPEAGSGMVILEPGETADFVVENVGEEAFYFTLVQFGVDFSIELFMPHPQHSIYKKESQKLAPGESASVREYFWRDERYHRFVEKGLPLRLPEDFPWAAEPGEENPLGILNLKLLLTREPTDFEFLEQRATRPARAPSHPLARLALLYSAGLGTRNFIPEPVEEAPEKDWATLGVAVGIRS